jgi:hypothetical protein
MQPPARLSIFLFRNRSPGPGTFFPFYFATYGAFGLSPWATLLLAAGAATASLHYVGGLGLGRLLQEDQTILLTHDFTGFFTAPTEVWTKASDEPPSAVGVARSASGIARPVAKIARAAARIARGAAHVAR